MTETLKSEQGESSEPPLNDWQTAVLLPTIHQTQPWGLAEHYREVTKDLGDTFSDSPVDKLTTERSKLILQKLDQIIENDPKLKTRFDALEKVVIQAVKATVKQCLFDNQGIIYTTLSGGVDSTLCLALIRKLYPDTIIHTFTAVSTKKHQDYKFAKAAAHQYSTIHHEIIVTPEDIQNLNREFKDYYGERYQPEGNINTWLTCREMKKCGASSFIAHDGIDEQTAGYWPHRAYGIGSIIEDQTKQAEAINHDWQRLGPDHLEILDSTAQHFHLKPLYPYLQLDLVRFLAQIPPEERAIKDVGKIIWKLLSRRFIPHPYSQRAKSGFGQCLRQAEEDEANKKRQGKKY